MSGPVFRFRIIILIGSFVVHRRHVHGQMLRRFAPAVRPQRAGRSRRRRVRRQIRRGRMTANVPADLFALFRMNCNNTTKISHVLIIDCHLNTSGNRKKINICPRFFRENISRCEIYPNSGTE